ncbi:MAG: leucyl aminopeptidase family protein [Emcibacteraceae bacterium]|nr:leucyl aminopeptidase family protein [Emcibacteraceae bacterium]
MPNYINKDDVQFLLKSSKKKTISIELIETDKMEGWAKNATPSQQQWIKANNFTAKDGEVITFSNEQGEMDLVLVGVSDEGINPWFFSGVVGKLPDGTYKIATELNELEACSAAFGWAMGHYQFDQYLKDKNDKAAFLIVPNTCDYAHVSALVNGTYLARDLVNVPTCDMGPTELEEVARKLSKTYSAKIKTIVGDDLLKKGFETIHTVGRAAEKEPRLIDMTWGHKDAPKVTLVGKGVCFDTGGLDIKPSGAMLTMKKDMGGAAHVLGLGQMIMALNLNIRLRILIPAVENNISSNAFRPGDIIKSYEGTTIEVGNTDAEGRLVLCDALALASEENPDLILDFATLTGAARVAMGPDVPPYFTDDANLSTALQSLSEIENDPLWPMPLYQPYKKLLNSSIADINNVATTGFGGAITAALFLKHFVGKDITWAHFDVYAWNTGNRPGKPKGGEAMGLRTVFRYLKEKYQS